MLLTFKSYAPYFQNCQPWKMSRKQLRSLLRSVSNLSSRNRHAAVRHISCSARLLGLKDRLLDPDLASSAVEYTSGKVNMLSQVEDSSINIIKFSPFGFTLKSGLRMMGSFVFFPTCGFSWQVGSVEEINARSLSMFTSLNPKIEVLIIGTGDKREDLSPDVIRLLREKKINFEILSTANAIATFNFQVSDQRWSAAALIPPMPSQGEIAKHPRKALDSKLHYFDYHQKDPELKEIEGAGEILELPSADVIAPKFPLGKMNYLEGETKVIKRKNIDRGSKEKKDEVDQELTPTEKLEGKTAKGSTKKDEK